MRKVRNEPYDGGYVWLCTFDSSGLFTGGLFRKADIEVNRSERIEEDELWAEGKQFLHTRSHNTVICHNGALIPLSPVED